MVAKSCSSLLSVLFWIGLSPTAVYAQVISDSTLSTTVTSTDNLNFAIENGTRAGANLFHSFEEFSVPTGGSAIFNNAINIETIFSRITGSNSSDVDGLIQANGSANLFLLNPNGIVFGSGVTLNIGGSFLASTADSIVFDNDVMFSAIDPEDTPFLSINGPIGLQFGSSPQAIHVNGPGHQLGFDIPTLSFIRDDRPAGVQVPDGQALALVGGDIVMEGGNLTAQEGRIALGSVADASLVTLSPTSDGFTFTYDDTNRFGDINLSQLSSIEVSGEGGGNIQLQGRQITLIEDSVILADTLGANRGGVFSANASESIEVIGSDVPVFPTGFFNQVAPGARGQGGDMIIETPHLTVSGASLIRTSTSGTGNSGDLRIDTQTLLMEGGGQISTATRGAGAGGTLTVHAADQIDIQGTLLDFISSGLFASVEVGGTGNGGNLRVETDRLKITDGGRISANTLDVGNGGNVHIIANEIEVSDLFIGARGSISGLSLRVEEGSMGNGGSLLVEANQLQVSKGGQVTAVSLGQGAAGDITLNVDTIEVSGMADDGTTPSRIAAFGTTEFSAGSVNIITDSLRVFDGAEINVSNQGAGDAGNLNVIANRLLLDNGGSIQAEVNNGSQGNFSLIANTLLLIDQGSLISTSASSSATGGNIIIVAPLIVGINNSDIVANAVEGNGGNIQLNVQSLFGLEFRDRRTPGNDITASSEFGIDGTVDINALTTNPDTSMVELPTNLVNLSDQITQGCGYNRASTFMIVGRGGLPLGVDNNRPWSNILPDFGMVPESLNDVLGVAREVLTDDIPEHQADITLSPHLPYEATQMAIASDGSFQLVASHYQNAPIPYASCTS